jgi:hypothetical protein
MKHPQVALPRAPQAPDLAADPRTWSAVHILDFADIAGRETGFPHSTHLALTWDDQALYVGAYLQASVLAAIHTERDAPIWEDDCFEFFLDPDGDHAHYVEVEVNALGTVWDLGLDRPYRTGNTRDNSLNLASDAVVVKRDGEVNDPLTPCQGWSVAMRLDWARLAPYTQGYRPKLGDRLRALAMRVDWGWTAHGPVLRRGPSPLYQTWGNQGAVDAHLPWRWAELQLTEGEAPFSPQPDEADREALVAEYLAAIPSRDERHGLAGVSHDLTWSAVRGAWRIDAHGRLLPR